VSEYDKFTPGIPGQNPNDLGQAALEALYITGDPRGIAALPENAEYDVREIVPGERMQEPPDRVSLDKSLEPKEIDVAAKARKQEIEYVFNPPDFIPARQRQRGEFTFDHPETTDFVEPGDPQAMLCAVVNSYFCQQPENLAIVTDRYNRLRERDPELPATKPRSSIAILMALHNERAITLRETIAEISRQENVDQDEILLYGNMPDSLSGPRKAQTCAWFDALVLELQLEYPHLKIRSVAEEYDWHVQDGKENEEVLMGKLRHDVVDLIALDGAARGFSIDHPVVFFDADTKQIAKAGVSNLVEVLTAPDAQELIAHLETHYLFDDDTGFYEDGTMTDARKLAIIQEVRRRQWWRIRHQHENVYYEDRNKNYRLPYDEEWGMAVALGPCLIAGNYNERGRLNESKDLKARLSIALHEISDIMRYAKPDIPSGRMWRHAYYVVGQAVRSSGRRQEQFLKDLIAGKVDEDAYERRTQRFIQSGTPYRYFSHTDIARTREQTMHPRFRNEEQARRIAAAVLLPDVVRVGDREIPMPDSMPLLQRYHLPLRDGEDGV